MEEHAGPHGVAGVGIGDTVALGIGEAAVDVDDDRAAGHTGAGKLGADKSVERSEVDGGETSGVENDTDGGE